KRSTVHLLTSFLCSLIEHDFCSRLNNYKPNLKTLQWFRLLYIPKKRRQYECSTKNWPVGRYTSSTLAGHFKGFSRYYYFCEGDKLYKRSGCCRRSYSTDELSTLHLVGCTLCCVRSPCRRVIYCFWFPNSFGRYFSNTYPDGGGVFCEHYKWFYFPQLGVLDFFIRIGFIVLISDRRFRKILLR